MQLQCDYCGRALGRVYVRRQLVRQHQGREQVVDNDWTDRFCDNDDNDCLVQWVQRGVDRMLAHMNP